MKIKSYFTQKTINPNQIKGIIQGVKNINRNSKKNLKEVLDSIDYDFSEEDNMKIDFIIFENLFFNLIFINYKIIH